jgi:hypothetical protein
MMPNCFVIMPFRAELNFFYRSIKAHLGLTFPELSVERGDDRVLDQPILRKINRMIRESGSPFSRPLSTTQTSYVSRRSRDILTLAARLLAQTAYAPSVFIPAVTDSKLIRTSHPSGSRHWGCS